uniref:THAP-type domain-containing protein n=1 Tax=Glossina brevipalpis TaxID=37001 RepID=A0A1A9WAK5_9MUSC
MVHLRKCVVEQCSSNKLSKRIQLKGMFRIRPEKVEMWLGLIGKEVDVNKEYFICEDHFEKDDFSSYTIYRKMIKREAIPTRNLQMCRSATKETKQIAQSLKGEINLQQQLEMNSTEEARKISQSVEDEINPREQKEAFGSADALQPEQSNGGLADEQHTIVRGDIWNYPSTSEDARKKGLKISYEWLRTENGVLISEPSENHLNDEIEKLEKKVCSLEEKNGLLKEQLEAQEPACRIANASDDAKVLAELIYTNKDYYTEAEKSICQLLYMHCPNCYTFMREHLEIRLPETTLLNS